MPDPQKQIAAHYSWANTPDRTKRTAPARKRLEDSFLAKVPPHITEPEARRKAAESLRRAHYLQMALRSAEARRARKPESA